MTSPSPEVSQALLGVQSVLEDRLKQLTAAQAALQEQADQDTAQVAALQERLSQTQAALDTNKTTIQADNDTQHQLTSLLQGLSLIHI